MICVDRNRVPIPNVFDSALVQRARKTLEDFYMLPTNQRRQKKFREQTNSQYIKDVKLALVKLFKGKCAYCESKIGVSGPFDLDHFRPKRGARGNEKEFSQDHYWWLTYEWGNLYECCRLCNQHKATWFPVVGARIPIGTSYDTTVQAESNLLIDPCNDNPREHLKFLDTGHVKGLTINGDVTIEILNLNRVGLIEARVQALKSIEQTTNEIAALFHQSANKKRNAIEFSNILKNIVEETSQLPYVAVQKQWLLNNIERFPEIQGLNLSKLDTKNVEVKSEQHKAKKKESESIEEKGQTTRTEFDTKQVFIERIKLKNFRCFGELDLELNMSIEKSWHLFLGENGVGKSSILKAIAIAFMSESYLEKMSENLEPSDLLKAGEARGSIEIIYSGGKQVKTFIDANENRIWGNKEKGITNIIGYGSTRLLPKIGKIEVESNTDEIKVGNLFDYSIALENASQWLLTRDQIRFDLAANALKDIMLLEQDENIEKSPNGKAILVVGDDEHHRNIETLSDGYRTVYAIAVDIMATLIIDEVSLDIVEGIVLIDEIGTHLHPTWKMQVVSQLRNTFKRVQFIVTTHEPLCLRGIKNNEVTVFKREGNTVSLVNDLPNPEKLRIDEILMSQFFGLNSVYDSETEKMFDRYYKILAKDESERTEADKELVINLEDKVPKARRLGDTIREDLLYYVIDETLAKEGKETSKTPLDLDEETKRDLVKRVKSIWAKLDSKK